MNRSIKLTACVLAMVTHARFSAPALATDRFFPDRTVTSPDGRWRLDAKSPANAGERPSAFATDFTYTLTDAKSSRVLWTRKQPNDEASPVSAFVHDSMWVVIKTAHNDLLALAPVSGERRLRFNILKDAFNDADRKFVHDTTAGPMWESRSHWYFLEHDSRVYFVIRTWWDRRVVADLTGGARMQELPAEITAACEEKERAFVIKSLDGAMERIQRMDEKDYSPITNAFTAVHLAGRMGVKDAIPHLREIERSEYVGSSGGWFDMEDIYKPGDVNPFNYRELSLRRSAHLALRRLGEKPSELPCVAFRLEAEEGLGEELAPAVMPAPRADRISMLKAGMKPREVLETIGAPDYLNFPLQAWEYEMDAEEPFTLRLFWRDKLVVDRWERIVPPLWKMGETRYKDD